MVKTAKPANQPSMPTMESIKAHITNEINKVRNLNNMIEDVLQSEVDRATVNSLESYTINFANKMKILGELQSEALELIRKDKFLGAQNAVAANERQIADHLVLHGVEELKSKLFFLQGQIHSAVKEFQAKGTTLQLALTVIKQKQSAQSLELKVFKPKGETPDSFVSYRLTRLPFRVTCSPFLMIAALLQNLKPDPHQTHAGIVGSLHMENNLPDSNNKEDVMASYPQLETRKQANTVIQEYDYPRLFPAEEDGPSESQ